MRDEDRPRAREEVLNRDLGSEYLLCEKNGDVIHVLNGTAREIYVLCDGTRSLLEISSVMVERYRVDEDTALQNVRRTVGELGSLGLLIAG